MRKLKVFLVVFFLAIGMNAQDVPTKLVELWKGTCGSKSNTGPDSSMVKAGGNVYDSLLIKIPYGECPTYEIHDSTGIRYGDHIIYVQALNDSVSKWKVDSVYIEVYLNFMTPDGQQVSTGYI